MTELRISIKNLGELALPDFCGAPSVWSVVIEFRARIP